RGLSLTKPSCGGKIAVAAVPPIGGHHEDGLRCCRPVRCATRSRFGARSGRETRRSGEERGRPRRGLRLARSRYGGRGEKGVREKDRSGDGLLAFVDDQGRRARL